MMYTDFFVSEFDFVIPHMDSNITSGSTERCIVSRYLLWQYYHSPFCT